YPRHGGVPSYLPHRKVGGKAAGIAPHVRAIWDHTLQRCLQPYYCILRLRSQPKSIALLSLVKDSELSQLNSQRLDLRTGHREPPGHRRELLSRPKRVQQRDMGHHPSEGVPIISLANRLDRQPELKRGDEDDCG